MDIEQKRNMREHLIWEKKLLTNIVKEGWYLLKNNLK